LSAVILDYDRSFISQVVAYNSFVSRCHQIAGRTISYESLSNGKDVGSF
jgi:hypothetical protein